MHCVVAIRREGASPAYARRQVECACGRIVRSGPHDGRHAADDALDDCLAQLREAGCSIAPDGAAVTTRSFAWECGRFPPDVGAAELAGGDDDEG